MLPQRLPPIHFADTCRRPTRSLPGPSTKSAVPTCQYNVSYNALDRQFSTALFSNTSLQNAFTTLGPNTRRRHLSATLFSNTSHHGSTATGHNDPTPPPKLVHHKNLGVGHEMNVLCQVCDAVPTTGSRKEVRSVHRAVSKKNKGVCLDSQVCGSSKRSCQRPSEKTVCEAG